MLKRTVFFVLLVAILISGTFLASCSKSTTTSTTTQTSTTTSQPAQTSTTTSPTTTKTTTTTSTTTTSGNAQTGGILTIISPQTPSSFGYPVETSGNAPGFVNVPWMESFISSDIKGNLIPMLATSWETAADKSSITWHLRQGVKFHDGTDFDADAAKWNLDVYLKNGTGAAAHWSSVDVIDKYTVRVNIKPGEYTNTQLTTQIPMISPTAYEKYGHDYIITHPVGTGPFMFKSFVRDTSLEYTRFDGYWGDKARIGGIKYLFIVDPTTAAMAFKGGDAQVWESADPKTAYDMVKNMGFKEETRRGPIMSLFPDAINADSPFSNLKVRQAVAYAIDTKSIVKSLGYGTWEAVNQPDVPEQFGYVPDLVGYPYNPDKARELLTEAGYPNGFSTTIYTASVFSQDPLVAIQANLADVGIQATIDVESMPKWFQIGMGGWNNGLFYVTLAATDFNYCAFLERYFLPDSLFTTPVLGYAEGFQDLVVQTLKSSDPAVYQPACQEMVKMLMDYVTVIPMWVQSEVYVEDPWVMDMGIGTHGDGFTWNTNKVWLAEH